MPIMSLRLTNQNNSMDEQDIVRQYYDATEVEKDRLETDYFFLEGMRTLEVINRYVTVKRSVIDIGGGAGFYAFKLKEKGHEVHLADLSEKNIDLVRQRSRQIGLTLDSAVVADARKLPYA